MVRFTEISRIAVVVHWVDSYIRSNYMPNVICLLIEELATIEITSDSNFDQRLEFCKSEYESVCPL